jgi:hypothetical protein
MLPEGPLPARTTQTPTGPEQMPTGESGPIDMAQSKPAISVARTKASSSDGGNCSWEA